MKLNLNKMTDHELLLLVAEHVVEKEPEVKRKLLTQSLTEKLVDSATNKLGGPRQLQELLAYGFKVTATIDYGGEKICTSSDYTDGAPLLAGHQSEFVEEFGRQLAEAKNALAEKIASTYDLERVGDDVDAEIQIKPRRIGL